MEDAVSLICQGSPVPASQVFVSEPGGQGAWG